MIVESFKPSDLKLLNEQVATAYLAEYMSAGQAEALVGPWSFTGWEDGRPLICAGVLPYWPGRGEAWAMVGMDAGPKMLSIHKAVKRFFEVAPFERIEAHVARDFAAGHQWVRMLGFEFEGVKPKYFPDGGTALGYAKVM